MNEYIFQGNIVDLHEKKIFGGQITINQGRIVEIENRAPPNPQQSYILPGFIDAHIHIESSMLPPSEFARLAVLHGTVATVSDPHEIANVLGIQGVRYMIRNNKKTNFPIFFGASPCVPATPFETAGASLSLEEIEELFAVDGLKYLSEMMNYPGVLNENSEVMKTLSLAKQWSKPIDGHAPGLTGELAKKYIQTGISTDHECIDIKEALDKLKYNMKIIIREGSAAKNYTALSPLIYSYPNQLMFCSDDKHPHELLEGHINELVKRSISSGFNLMDVLRIACLNPINHYGLDIGTLKIGDRADFIIVKDLKDFLIEQTYIAGIKMADKGKSLNPSIPIEIVNNFNCAYKTQEQFALNASTKKMPIIQIVPDELMTKSKNIPLLTSNGFYTQNLVQDILKLTVVNRYSEAPPAMAFIKGFGLKKGAIASSVAHDSHNIIAVGVDDISICEAVNAIIECKGGISVVENKVVKILPLPIAGLMSNKDAYIVAKSYLAIKQQAQNLGSLLSDPFMTLSFMALLVIPSLKLSDRGLFDVNKFRYYSEDP